MKIAFILVGLYLSASVLAVEHYPFLSSEESARFHQLLSQFRCLVCQNESIGDSQSALAADLREVVYEQVRRGESSAMIRDYLLSRYGDFVLLKPRFVPKTWLLWMGPFLLLGIGAIVVFRVSRGAAR